MTYRIPISGGCYRCRVFLMKQMKVAIPIINPETQFHRQLKALTECINYDLIQSHLQALDGNGELPENGSFPQWIRVGKGSLIVNSALNILAVIKKAPTDANAGDGWLWAEYAVGWHACA